MTKWPKSHYRFQSSFDYTFMYGSFHQVGARFVTVRVNCYIRKCTIYYHWLWLVINIVVISYWRRRDWFHSNLKNNCECAYSRIIDGTCTFTDNNWHRHKSCPNLVEWPISKNEIFRVNPIQAFMNGNNSLALGLYHRLMTGFVCGYGRLGPYRPWPRPTPVIKLW